MSQTVLTFWRVCGQGRSRDMMDSVLLEKLPPFVVTRKCMDNSDSLHNSFPVLHYDFKYGVM